MLTERWRADDPHDELPEATGAKIAQLGVLACDGRILERPSVRPGTWRSEVRMRRFRRREGSGQSKMGDVWTNLGEVEADRVFGVLPGEEWNEWGVVNEDAEKRVAERFGEERRCEGAIWDGERLGGVWRDMVCDQSESGLEEIVAWVCEERKRWEGRVMDPRCVGVVKGVMNVDSL